VIILSGHGVNDMPLDLVLHVLRVLVDIAFPVSKRLSGKLVEIDREIAERVVAVAEVLLKETERVFYVRSGGELIGDIGLTGISTRYVI